MKDAANTDLKDAESELETRLRLAQEATGPNFKGVRPPRELMEQLRPFEFPEKSEDCERLYAELEADLEMLDDVDPQVLIQGVKGNVVQVTGCQFVSSLGCS